MSARRGQRGLQKRSRCHMIDLPGGFLLIATGVPHEKVERIVRCFTEAWSRVPSHDRAAIQARYAGKFVFLRPSITDPAPAAAANWDGHLMWLNSLAVFVFPGGDADITLAIAEELAHAFLITVADPSHAPDASSDTKERAAQAVIERWGCDMSAHRRLMAGMEKCARP